MVVPAGQNFTLSFRNLSVNKYLSNVEAKAVTRNADSLFFELRDWSKNNLFLRALSNKSTEFYDVVILINFANLKIVKHE